VFSLAVGCALSWLKIDDGFHSHPKVLEAGNEAVGLWVRCGAYCAQHLTDGFVPRQIVLIYGSVTLAEVLVEVRLWVSVDGGWQMNDFLTYNRSRSQVLSDRKEGLERQRRSRERRKGVDEGEQVDAINGHSVSHSVTTSDSHSVSHASVTPTGVTPTRPDPITTNKNKRSAEADQDFAEFWTHYPRKRQKTDARTAWTQQLRKNVTPERMINGSAGYAQHCRDRNIDDQFIKYPGAWLRAGGYDDYQPEPDPLDGDPAEVLRELWRIADAKTVASILRVPFVDRPQPPSDGTPRDQWLRDSRRSWIEDHIEAAKQALSCRQSTPWPLTPPHPSQSLSNGASRQHTVSP
jgi:hypothetical protein